MKATGELNCKEQNNKAKTSKNRKQKEKDKGEDRNKGKDRDKDKEKDKTRMNEWMNESPHNLIQRHM